MSVFGTSMPDDVQKRLDKIASIWQVRRSPAFVRIFLEWEAYVKQYGPIQVGHFPQPDSAEVVKAA